MKKLSLIEYVNAMRGQSANSNVGSNSIKSSIESMISSICSKRIG